MVENTRGCELVCFDLETTGFSKDDEIIQISAYNRKKPFNAYILPTKPVHWKATQVTGLQLCDNHLYLHDEIVPTTSPINAFNAFMEYLKCIKKKIILVAHNCFGFDMPRIIKLAGELNLLEEFQKIVYGFSDSLVILRYLFRGERGGKGSFTLHTLVQDYVSRDANDEDIEETGAKALDLLLSNKGLDVRKKLIVDWSKSFKKYFKEQKMKLLVLEAKRSLQCYRNTLPTWVINKMARTRITRAVLRDIFQNCGFEGIQRLFSKNYYGRPRVTKSIKIISSVCNTIRNDLCGNL